MNTYLFKYRFCGGPVVETEKQAPTERRATSALRQQIGGGARLEILKIERVSE